MELTSVLLHLERFEGMGAIGFVTASLGIS